MEQKYKSFILEEALIILSCLVILRCLMDMLNKMQTTIISKTFQGQLWRQLSQMNNLS